MMNLKDNLKEKYVAFLDVLGFKELVGSRKIDQLEIYFNSIEETLRDIRNDKHNIQSLLVSDSTILIAPDTKEDFKTLLRAVQTIQYRLALKDIWIRGAVSFGDVYFDTTKNLVVGKGLINAYLLESEALYPRVILDTSIIPRLANDRADFFEFINPDYGNDNFVRNKNKLIHNWHQYTEDDSFFIAYGHRIILDLIENRNIDLIYKKISKNLYSDPRYYKKFLWVKNYFSEVLYNLEERWMAIPTEKRDGTEKETIKYINKWWKKFISM